MQYLHSVTLKTVVKAILSEAGYGRQYLAHLTVSLPRIPAAIFVIATWTKAVTGNACIPVKTNLTF